MELAAEAQKRGEEEAEHEEISRKKGGRAAAYERAKREGGEKEFLAEEEEFERGQERGKREGWEWTISGYVKKSSRPYLEEGWGGAANPQSLAESASKKMGYPRDEQEWWAKKLLEYKPPLDRSEKTGNIWVRKGWEWPQEVVEEQFERGYFHILGRGGIIAKPTVAMLGEAGAEAILPLSQPRRIFEILRTLPGMGKYRLGEQDWPMVGQYPRGQLQHITINNTFPGPYYIREEADIDKLSRELYRKQKQSQRAVGIF